LGSKHKPAENYRKQCDAQNQDWIELTRLERNYCVISSFFEPKNKETAAFVGRFPLRFNDIAPIHPEIEAFYNC
jgi:hypothetical protein